MKDCEAILKSETANPLIDNDCVLCQVPKHDPKPTYNRRSAKLEHEDLPRASKKVPSSVAIILAIGADEAVQSAVAGPHCREQCQLNDESGYHLSITLAVCSSVPVRQDPAPAPTPNSLLPSRYPSRHSLKNTPHHDERPSGDVKSRTTTSSDLLKPHARPRKTTPWQRINTHPRRSLLQPRETRASTARRLRQHLPRSHLLLLPPHLHAHSRVFHLRIQHYPP